MLNNRQVAATMKIRLDEELPEKPAFAEGIRRAPDRGFRLSKTQTETALKNALRYIPEQHHQVLIPEFLDELKNHGRIYGYRFRPAGRIHAKPVNQYQGNCLEARAFQLMLDNKLGCLPVVEGGRVIGILTEADFVKYVVANAEA